MSTVLLCVIINDIEISVFEKDEASFGERYLYLTNTVVNGRVLVRYKRGNLAAGWLPIKPHTVRRVVICQQVMFS